MQRQALGNLTTNLDQTQQSLANRKPTVAPTKVAILEPSAARSDVRKRQRDLVPKPQPAQSSALELPRQQVRVNLAVSTENSIRPLNTQTIRAITPAEAIAYQPAISSCSLVDDDHGPEFSQVASSAREYEDIDAEDMESPQFVAEYADDIYAYYREREVRRPVNPKYMLSQLDINESMRKLLVNWMVEVSIEFQLMSETLFLSVSLLDQFLQLRKVPRDRLQLLGMASMLLASKYEEIWHPPVEDFIYISAGTYERDDVIKMELYMLQTLQFDIGFPTSLHFLRRFSKAARSDPRLHTCCKYFIELALPQYSMVAFRPSVVAASAVYLGRKLAGKKPLWNETLQHYTTFTEDQLIPCVKSLVCILRKEAVLMDDKSKPVTAKYSSKSFYQVSTTVLDYYRRVISKTQPQ